jgi:hypothetical protein
MHSSIIVTKPAPDKSLITLYEAKVALKIAPSSSDSDELLKFIILRSSDEVQTLCSRVFPKEAVVETFREIEQPITKLYLSRYPVQPLDVVSITADAGDVTGFDIDPESGKLSLTGGALWAESVVATYAGGYAIPQEVPPAIKQAVLLFTRDAYYASQRGDASVRQISHKESRISYFDPSKMGGSLSSSSGGGGSPAENAARNLLQRYTRLTA